jgi:protein TonB
MEERSARFRIYSALAASLVMHAAVLTLLLVPLRTAVPPPKPLIIEILGIVDDTQTVEKHVQETKAQPDDTQPPAVETPPPPPQPQPQRDQPQALEQSPPPRPAAPAPPRPRASDRQETATAKERDKARRLTQEELERAELQQYVRLLTQRVAAHTLSPPEARAARLEGTAKVSVAILADGSIAPDSVHIATSSGQAVLDAAALDTIRASVPFDPPPHPITVVIWIVFHQKS